MPPKTRTSKSASVEPTASPEKKTAASGRKKAAPKKSAAAPTPKPKGRKKAAQASEPEELDDIGEEEDNNNDDEVDARQQFAQNMPPPAFPAPSRLNPNPVRSMRAAALREPFIRDSHDTSLDSSLLFNRNHPLRFGRAMSQPVQGSPTMHDTGFTAHTPIRSAPPEPITPPRNLRADAELNNLRRLAEPWTITLAFYSILRFFRNLNYKTVFFLLGLLYALNSIAFPHLPVEIRAVSHRLSGQLRHQIGLPVYSIRGCQLLSGTLWTDNIVPFCSDNMPDTNIPGEQWAHNIWVNEKLDKLHKTTKHTQELIDHTSQITKRIQDIEDNARQMLPRLTLLEKNSDGDRVIPDHIYTAFASKLAGDEKFWTEWKKINDIAIDAYAQRHDSSNRDEIEKYHAFVNPETFIELIKSDTRLHDEVAKMIEQQVAGQVAEKVEDQVKFIVSSHSTERKAILHAAAQIVASEVDKVLSRYEGLTLLEKDLLQRTKEIELTNRAAELSEVNFFSPLLAKIDPRLTSPTASQRQSHWLASLYARFAHPQTPPVAVLMPWREAFESWCAAESDGQGKAQVGIITSQQVIPERLYVEHIPHRATANIATAPQEYELWMDAKTEEAAGKLRTWLQANLPSWLNLKCGMMPAEGFVCIGTGRYDIHNENWVQSIKLPMLGSGGTSSDRFVFRATSNWNAVNTCIYRLRLAGRKPGQV